MFIDRVKIRLVAGKGGNGIVAWRREKFIPKGGPSGGNGGRGGSVTLKATPQAFSLEYFRNRRILRAEDGKPGGINNQQGKNGRNLILEVPCGTLVKNSSTGEVLHDFTKEGEEWIACVGGRGGRGNDSFKGPTNQAPNKCTMGTEGEEQEFELELKLIADVGLVGFPNAGKSTLITAMTHVRVKIAPYPFTTLQPNLGYIETEDYHRIFIADIPGIIEGAHRNRGLGFEFLRHIERTKLLLFVIDASGIDGRSPLDDWRVLREELEKYNPEMMNRSFLVILNKCDAEEAQENIQLFKESYQFDPKTLYVISALEGKGIPELQKSIEEIFS